MLRRRSLGAEAEGERQAVVIYLDEVRPLIGALVDAAAEMVNLAMLGTQGGGEP